MPASSVPANIQTPSSCTYYIAYENIHFGCNNFQFESKDNVSVCMIVWRVCECACFMMTIVFDYKIFESWRPPIAMESKRCWNCVMVVILCCVHMLLHSCTLVLLYSCTLTLLHSSLTLLLSALMGCALKICGCRLSQGILIGRKWFLSCLFSYFSLLLIFFLDFFVLNLFLVYDITLFLYSWESDLFQSMDCNTTFIWVKINKIQSLSSLSPIDKKMKLWQCAYRNHAP